ncbi:MAG: hypothetical protein K9J21_08910 [Bacteroidales bacterium]|nr:hypothetical protein [Bacteroidales bacterium]
MKKNFLRMATLLMIIVSLVSYSCEKEDDSDDNNNNNNNNEESNLLPQSLSMEVDGTSWEADESTIKGMYWDPEIIIQGSRQDGSSNIQMVYEGIWTAGTYTFKRVTYNAPNGNFVLTDPSHSTLEFTSFTVQDSTSQDSTFTGNFSATLVDTTASPMDTIEISNGYFENIYFNN